MAMDAERLAELRAKYANGWALTVWEQGTVLQALGAVTRERDRLRSALELCEFAGWDRDDGDQCCPDCGALHSNYGVRESHCLECRIGRALGRPECQDDCEACQIERDEVGDGR